MFKAIRDLFTRKEDREEVIELPFEEVPGWLDAHEQEIQDELMQHTAASREKIPKIQKQLQQIVASLESAGEQSDAHPRLRSIAKTALPQFVRSMRQILAKEPSGDPEEFYATASEMLKGCIKALRGQGKYLFPIFTEEMREFRTGVRDLGTEINAMTGAITQARTHLDRVADLREIHRDMVHTQERHAGMLAEAVQAEEMLGGHERKVLELQEAISRLERDPAFAACSEMEQQIRALEAERAEMVRRSAGVTLPAMQVLRKVEKIAGKRQDRIIRDKVRRLRDLLADLPAGQETERDALLLDVMPSVLDLIREGELTLKNKEEQHLFSDDQTLRNELSGIAALFRDVDDRLSRTRSRLADTPVLLERERLIMELEECRRRQQALQAALEESRQQIEKMSHTFADLTERLHERTKDLDDRDIAVSVEMLPAYAGHGAA
ncbi:MAG: hypothetical protein KO206_05965 [Methanomicrobiaceae archaeon]|nr:hypothetical protein [Methanomicrobiaceae archaeon]MDD5418834.1 hypothetical protein [Methanomicrobiaceae archaeon]